MKRPRCRHTDAAASRLNGVCVPIFPPEHKFAYKSIEEAEDEDPKDEESPES